MNLEEELIEHVKKHPIIFDTSNKEYRNKNARNEAWEEIGRILEISGNECRELWTKLRNAYTNAMKRRKSKSGQGTKNMIKWKYDEQMEFLAHTLEQRTTHENTEVKEEDESEGEEIPQEESSSILPHAPLEENVSLSNPSIPLFASSPRHFRVPTATRKNRKMETSMNEMVKIMEENSGVGAQMSSSNEMDMFFLSLSKTVQRLSPEEQVRVKMEVGNVVFQAEFRELQRLRQQTQGNPPYLPVIYPPSFDSSIPQNLHSTSSSQHIHLPSHSSSSLSSSPHAMTSPPPPNETPDMP